MRSTKNVKTAVASGSVRRQDSVAKVRDLRLRVDECRRVYINYRGKPPGSASYSMSQTHPGRRASRAGNRAQIVDRMLSAGDHRARTVLTKSAQSQSLVRSVIDLGVLLSRPDCPLAFTRARAGHFDAHSGMRGIRGSNANCRAGIHATRRNKPCSQTFDESAFRHVRTSSRPLPVLELEPQLSADPHQTGPASSSLKS